MSKEKQIVIKEAAMTNNCPECYSQELQLTFFQKHIYNAFFHRTTNEVTHSITCKKCNSKIFPVNWTSDIERVFEYFNKLVKPEPPSIRFTSLFYILIIVGLSLMGVGYYLYLEGII